MITGVGPEKMQISSALFYKIDLEFFLWKVAKSLSDF